MPDTGFASLHSPRLVLRRLRDSDLVPFCAYRSLPEVARYQSWETFTPAEGERFFQQQALLVPDIPGTWFQMAIELTESGALIGDCGLHCRLDDPRQAEVGITLAPTYHGQGYAAEALRCLLDYAFLTLQKHRVVAVVDAENVAVARLMERVGMRREAHYRQNIWFKGKWGDEMLYAVLATEWSMIRAGPE